MTKPDSDPVGNSTPSSRSRGRGPGPILDLERSRVKDETPPAAAPPEGSASETAGPVGSSASQAPAGEFAAASSGPEAGLSSATGSGSNDASPNAKRPRDPASPARGGGFGRLLGASLLGGVIGAGLGLAGERAWREHAGDPVQARLAQIEQRTQSTPWRDAVGALERRVAAAEAALKEASDRAREAQSAAGAAAARAEEAANRPPPEAPPPPPAPDTAAIEQLTSRLSALEAEMRSGAQARNGGIETLERRLAEQDGRLAAIDARLADAAKADAARDEALQSRLSDAERRVEAQDGRLAALSQEGQQRATALTQSVDQRLGALSQEGQQRVAALTQSVDARVADLARTVAQGQGREEVRATARLAVAERIARALHDGEPYAPALASLRRLGAQGDGIAALEPFAASGAPKAADLARAFRPVADRLRAESRTNPDAGASASWKDRLRQLAGSVVTVRPLDGDAGTGPRPADPVAAVASALDRGDISAAAKAWDEIPEPARQDAREFGTRLKQRAAAEEAVEGVSRDTLASLDASTQ